ncbi:hypothetical protein ACFSJM_06840 [Lactococcus formosensis subsp. bovis]|uniref:hypothetical protein n=1 Tax=Lactococcus formosensis TaxID=1281486 RepID=UPI001BCB88A3|nr:hypothetical protein [Lactococcus formosensis]
MQRQTKHIGYAVTPQSFDEEKALIQNQYKDQVFYSQIFQISGTDFSEFITQDDKIFYGEEVTSFLDSNLFQSNITIGNVPINLSKQINFWTHKIGRSRYEETANQARYIRNMISNLAQKYNEPSYYIEIFNSNQEAFKNLEYMLQTSERIMIKKVTEREEIIKIKRSALNPTSNLR